MFNNLNKNLFFLTLMSGTMITISSSSWLSAWMGLEINLLSLIPLINNSNNLMSSETALKYFLTQAIASSIFFFASILSTIKMNLSMNPTEYQMLIAVSLMIKTGIAPFHFWLPMIMEGLTWINTMILLTWQKIAPLMLLFYVFNMKIMLVVIILSAMVGSMSGLNQTSLRKIMAFSSINHLAWMTSSMMESLKLFIIYFTFYSFLSITVMVLFHYTSTFHIKQLMMSMNSNTKFKMVLFMNLLSLGGLPPFLGFIPKWIVIQQMILMNQSFILFVLMMSSLITLFFYLRLGYSSFMMGNMSMNWMTILTKTMSNKFISAMSTVSIMGLPLISLYYI